jgi:chemotaxis response regulator CheB
MMMSLANPQKGNMRILVVDGLELVRKRIRDILYEITDVKCVFEAQDALQAL